MTVVMAWSSEASCVHDVRCTEICREVSACVLEVSGGRVGAVKEGERGVGG